MKTALTIAGGDSNGGTGIQVDIRIMTAHGVYAMSAITTLTAQSITGVIGTMEVTPFLLKERLDDIFTDISPGTVKIGMVSSGGLTKTTGNRLAPYRATSVVADPVMVSTGGPRLISSGAVEALEEVLLPMVNLLTPNVPRAEVLSGVGIHSPDNIETTVRTVGEGYGYVILLRSGHQLDDTNDLLYQNKKLKQFKSRRINNPDIHGTSCTLSSAIASNLAKDMGMDLAVKRARVYLSGALKAQLDLGKRGGPMSYGSVIQGKY